LIPESTAAKSFLHCDADTIEGKINESISENSARYLIGFVCICPPEF
jgi:hypothetical protein